MFFKSLFKKKQQRIYRTVYRGKLIKRDNILEEDISPIIYKDTPPDKFAGMDEIKSQMENDLRDTLHAMRLPLEKTSKIFSANTMEILEIPAVYLMLKTLNKRDLRRFIKNSHALATLVQACCCYGISEMVNSIQANLLHVMLGIYARHYGIQFMKQDEYQSLLISKKFNMNDPKERELRDDFFKSFKTAAEKLSDTSIKKLGAVLDLDKCKSKNLKPIIHIIRFSSRLMGRTALDMNRNTEQDIHQLASYVGVLYSIVSAMHSTKKRLCTILAEEYDRNRTHHKHEGVEKTARYNIYAINDLLRVCRCRVLDFFQGTDEYAIFNEAENIFVRKADDGRGGKIWSCFKSETKTMTFAEREKRCLTLEDKAKHDPKDADLVQIFDTN
ncbi:MAG: hypothetical protein ACYTFY_10700 [Planctomycetota bacterium]